MKNVRITISGKLNDTGYLYFTKQMAGQFNINGFVKYSDSDSVFIEAEGKPKALNKFIEFCKIGSYDSNVLSIETSEGEITGYSSFDILPAMAPAGNASEK